jgi:hypothetical protein
MKEEIFETVLNEILEELRKSNKSLDSLLKPNESAPTKENIASVQKDIANVQKSVTDVQKDVTGSREDIGKTRADIGKLRENIPIPQPPNLRPIIRQFRITLFGSILLVAIATIIFFATPYRLFQLPPVQHQDTSLPPPHTITPPTTNKQLSPPHHHLPGHKKNNSDTLHKKDIYEIADSLLKSKP